MSQATRWDSRDRSIAVALTVLGGAGLMVALLRHWNAQEMNPGIEGSLTVGILAPILALSAGVGYRATVAMTLPVLLIQGSACLAAQGPALAVAGLELCCLGFLGFLGALSQSEPAAPARPRAPSATPQRPAPGGAHPAPF